MPSRVNSYHPERKIEQPAPAARPSAGTAPSMPQKQGYSRDMLPGKASNGFAAAKKGIREVNGYAYYKGLSERERSTSEEYSANAKRYQKSKAVMDEYRMQENAGTDVVNNALRNKSKGYNALAGNLQRSDTDYGALYQRMKKK